MFFISVPLTALEIAVFIIVAIAFLFAVFFFIDSRKKIQLYFSEESFPGYKPKPKPVPVREPKRVSNAKTAEETDELRSLKLMMLRQQDQLSSVISQLRDLEITKKDEDPNESDWAKEDEYNAEVEQLQITISKRDAEIKSLKQQNELATKIQERFDDLQTEFDTLQSKLQSLEEQSWAASELTMKLENMEQANHHLEKELLRKEERLLELTEENLKTAALLNETEDKLREANNQRQQLARKIQYLEEMNNDLKQLSDTNRKLQVEIRRIGELESMLQLIMDERDELLKRVQH